MYNNTRFSRALRFTLHATLGFIKVINFYITSILYSYL